MAQNITLLGASYSGIPAILLPKTGGGTSRFDDASVTTATSSDVASGKVFLAADGTITTGTSSGGGTSPWTLIASQTSSISTTSTSAATAVTINGGSAISTADKIVWVHIRDTAGPRAGYFYGSDAFFVNINRANSSTSTFATPTVIYFRYSTSSAYAGSSGQYGVYGYSISSTGSLIIRRRYNSTNSLTIDGTYQIDVYTLDLPSGLTLFG